ncbi:MAG: hypothetical protein ABFD89_19310 [Bryobacteraceae bacterium]
MMKKDRTCKFLLLAGLVAILAIPAAAQTPRLTADIPFEFIAGGQTMPAGEYSVGDFANIPCVVISGWVQGTRENVVFLTQRAQPMNSAQNSRLVFNKYGDKYFLAEIWGFANELGWRVPQSRLEREAARTAMRVSPPSEQEVVTILARR